MARSCDSGFSKDLVVEHILYGATCLIFHKIEI